MSLVNFEEKQRFSQWWIWFSLIALAALVIYDVASREEDSLASLLLALGMLGLVFLLLLSIQLQTKINARGIHVKMFPFHLSYVTYSWESLDAVEVVKYSPLGDYGGLGVRISLRGKGKAFNIRGNQGIKIQTAAGKIRMIGTQQREAAQEAIDYYFSKKA